MQLSAAAPSFPARVQKLVGPFPGAKEGRAMATFGLLAAALMCGLSLFYGWYGEAFMGRPPGGDFVQFYAAGQILNTQPPARIYDVPLLVEYEHRAVPAMPANQMLIFGNAPYIAWLFAPLAKLPYFAAYCVWLVFTLALFSGGLWLLLRRRFAPPVTRLAFVLALSAPMLTFESWIGGQLSAIAFAAVCCFLVCIDGKPQKQWLAGAALGCLIFKPSLLALPLLAMVISGNWRILAGFASSASAMAGLTVISMGLETCRRWLDVLRLDSFLLRTQAANVHFSKNVDFNGFFYVLAGAGWFSRALAGASILAVVVPLAWLCWRLRQQQDQRLMWAAVLLATPLIGVYFPVYDSVIVLPAVILAASCCTEVADRTALQGWLTPLWLVPWLTQTSADFLHLQLLTPLLVGFAWWVGWQAKNRATV